MARRTRRSAQPAGAPTLHVVTSTQRRGAETFAVDLAAALDERGLPSPVVALAPGPAGGPGARLAVPTLGARSLAPATLSSLRRRAAGARLVVAHGSRTLPACVAALAGTSTPVVYRSIGDPTAWSAHGLRRVRTRALLGRTAAVVALWPAAAAAIHRLHRVPTDRVHTIPNGVPAGRCPVPGPDDRRAARAALGLPPSGPVVAYIGALGPEKQVDRAVDALTRVPEAHLLVVGGGTERPDLERQAAATVPGRVTFAGVLDGPGTALAAADVVVLPSRTEGLPGVLVEAGLSAVAAVATHVGGVAEIVRDGETGVLVPPGDVDELAAGLRRALDDHRRMGDAARRHCLDRFEIGPVADRWACLVEGLVH